MKRDRDEQEQEDDVDIIEEVKKSPEKKSKILTSTSISTSEAFECSDIACFGAGCYWGTEQYIKYRFTKLHPNTSIVEGKVGFMGPVGSIENPSYKEVCSGSTGHVEVYDCKIQTDEGKSNQKISDVYRDLVKFFFQFHDPTTGDRQGNDKGTQYASVIYCTDDVQKRIATQVKDELQKLIDYKLVRCYSQTKITTDIRMRTEFFEAHKEHQDYLMKNPKGYCNHKIKFSVWPDLAVYEANQKAKKDGNGDNDVFVFSK